jgi:hypothetical protein
LTSVPWISAAKWRQSGAEAEFMVVVRSVNTTTVFKTALYHPNESCPFDSWPILNLEVAKFLSLSRYPHHGLSPRWATNGRQLLSTLSAYMCLLVHCLAQINRETIGKVGPIIRDSADYLEPLN